MTRRTEHRAEVLRLAETIRRHLDAQRADPYLMGAALIEVGVEHALAKYRRAASRAEAKLVQSHFPDATEEGIRKHCLTPEGVGHMLSLVVTLARKYLDHQPEAASALDACPDDGSVKSFAASMTRTLENAYSAAPAMGLTAYDVAAASITNASLLASQRGVALEQLAIIHLEGIARALERPRSN